MDSELILTEDGSHTLFVPGVDECYHSSHGAMQESTHIFIEAGLKHCLKQEIKVLEIGFGTGLNAFLTLIEAERSGIQIQYTALELYPVKVEKALLLNYADQYSPEMKKYFESIQTSAWNTEVQISPFFSLEKIKADFTTVEFPKAYDVIYFDAFSPEKQPEMWSQEQFEKICKYCHSGAILTTYCAKGAVRRAMQAAGFNVERLPGPPGKREILRAVKLKD
ncbi:MAG: tRNA (5-methylaminomethyl-2-thiouridine)(34)-methyltransferase MnmD [Bacteroidales bacterium]|nr:tRNA (5-methylaminomethyl-2-thiouridine)(34)-methyltransferase MnmD [Bacteroidales bacterium]